MSYHDPHDAFPWGTLILAGVGLCLAYALTSCTTTQTPPQPGVVGSLKADWDAKHPEWTALLVKELGGKELLKYAPAQCDPMPYYVLMISTLSRFESNHRSEVKYTENFNDNQGRRVVSRGVLQVSKESCNGYGAGITDEEQLHDPAVNFRCAVLILNKWIPRDGVLTGGSAAGWKGGARYWSPLRDGEKAKVIFGRAKEACK